MSLLDKKGKKRPYLEGIRIVDSSGEFIDAQNPLASDGDSIYAKDIDLANSDIGDFSGSVTDLFDNRTSTITSDVDNPSLRIALQRPVHNQALSLITSSGNFSNVIIIARDASGTILETINESGISDKETSQFFNFVETDKWCVLDIVFTTTDTITLSFIDVYKSVHVAAHLHAVRPDGTVAQIGATQAGNLKVSVEEDDTMNAYVFHDLQADSEDSNVKYIGKEKKDGKWLVAQMDKNIGLGLLYANESNNDTLTTYTTAYAARESLTYELLENLTNL